MRKKSEDNLPLDEIDRLIAEAEGPSPIEVASDGGYNAPTAGASSMAQMDEGVQSHIPSIAGKIEEAEKADGLSLDEINSLIEEAEIENGEGPDTFDEPEEGEGSVMGAIALGVTEGLEQFRGSGELLIKELGQVVGLVNQESIDNQRRNLGLHRKHTMERPSAKAHPYVFKGAELATDIAAGSIAFGGAGKLAQGIGGAGKRLFAQGAIPGALIGGYSDPGEEGSRLKNAFIGGAAGGVASKVLGGGIKQDEEAAAAFASLGVTPFASQVAGGKISQKVTGALERGLNLLPVVGTRGVVRNQLNKAREGAAKVLDDLNSGVGTMEAISGKFDDMFNSAAGKSPITLVKTNKSIRDSAYKLVEQSQYRAVTPETKKFLIKASKLEWTSVRRAHALRKDLDDIILNVKKSGAPDREVKALTDIRKVMETEIENKLGKFSQGKAYKALKKEYLDRRAIDELDNLITKSTKNEILNTATLANNIKKSKILNSADTDKKIRLAAKGIKLVGDKIKNAGLQSSGVSLTGIGVAGAAGYNIAANPILTGQLVVTTYALRKLMTTKVGLDLLAHVGKKGFNTKTARTLFYMLPILGGEFMPQLIGELSDKYGEKE